ncbi:YqgE/AlgH family protein [Providencia alcalifaciens]|uniref:YqgE/AlgH family protein n=1 Tax=Providencia alcalifaciens TaxID=126385 RepID=UPI0012B50E72|nr:YqgE/AlgH family protein [Providencia alcalifaciens]MTC31683.1 YqgE/AlgH family protein [Providencia alcalifaciens]
MNLHNHFLIAMPSLTDPYFDHSVVYICEHNENGAMGLVINKPIEDFSVSEMLKKLEITISENTNTRNLEKLVIAGGPVSEEHGFIIHTPVAGYAASLRLNDHVMVTTSKDILETLGSDQHPMNSLVTLGYSSWEPGQLENEIMENSWLTVKADPKLIFDTPLRDRWKAAGDLLGIDIHNISLQAGHA